MLSAIVIAENEEKLIGDCLMSLSFADEIIVVDSGSTDNTITVAKSRGARVVKVRGDDFSAFRNKGLYAAEGDWILYVDADERVSPLLRREVQTAISDGSPVGAYALLRKNIYLGRHMQHGGWGNDYVIRLFNKSKLEKWQYPLHEQPVYSGKLEKLSEALIHFSHRDLSSMVDKTLLFTVYEARLRFDSGHPPMVVWRFLRVMYTEFWLRFVKLGAWRDGTEGVIDGIFQVFNMFIIYARLWEMQNIVKSDHSPQS